VFGQAVHLTDGSWVSWGNLGTLIQGTVEFWANLDTLNYSDGFAGLIQSDYSQFYASTFSIDLVNTNYVYSIYDCDCGLSGGNGNWIGMPNPIAAPSFSVTTNCWHHFATTWGSQGFHFYIDGTLVYSNANTEGLSPYTAYWAIGGLVGGGTDSSSGFTGAIDELRISNIQRVFAPATPQANFVKAFTVDYSSLLIGSNYQSQASPDLVNWTNWGAAFTATNSTYTNTNYQRISDWNQLFFRVVQQ
jgi:hypothetical protein